MPEKVYSTLLLLEKLNNALESGYVLLGETDIGDLLLECEAAEQGVQPTIATAALEDSPWQTGARRNAVILPKPQ